MTVKVGKGRKQDGILTVVYEVGELTSVLLQCVQVTVLLPGTLGSD